MWDSIFDFYYPKEELQEKLEIEEQTAVYRLPKAYLKHWQMPGFLETANKTVRKQEKQAILDSWKQWQKGFGSIAAVIGYLGEGVTLFLRSLQSSFDPGQFLYLKLNKKITDEKSLVEIINLDKLINRELKIIVVDNCHHLFLRKPGAFKALKLFLKMIMDTNKDFFWITGWGRQGWIYLDNIFNLSRIFSTVIPFHQLDEEEFRSLFLTAGYEGDYQVSVADNFFSKMVEYTGGLITPAIYYWLMCSEEQEGNWENKTILLKERHDILQYRWLEELSEEEIYLLMALLQGDGLALGYLARILEMDYLRCQMIVTRMFKKRLLIADDDVYLVNPLALPAVKKALVKRRIISFAL